MPRPAFNNKINKNFHKGFRKQSNFTTNKRSNIKNPNFSNQFSESFNARMKENIFSNKNFNFSESFNARMKENIFSNNNFKSTTKERQRTWFREDIRDKQSRENGEKTREQQERQSTGRRQQTEAPPKMNYYEFLGVKSTATPEEIRRAYKALALRLHPDKGGSAENMIILNLIKETLLDPSKRREYNQSIGVR
ncbi:MAG TPA: J domain-containing protein [archaeon]|jgi:hypothetical protein|nr:J domain-containing protein [archaeon]HPV66369.1 J domain-containing protein [archaeon]